MDLRFGADMNKDVSSQNMNVLLMADPEVQTDGGAGL